jgi:hypothetical protein
MPRIARFLKEDEKAVYHVISRTALDGLPFKDSPAKSPFLQAMLNVEC